MDISVFDFEREELVDVLGELAELTAKVELEPRLHEPGERVTTAEGNVPLHADRTAPAFRICCTLRGGDDTVRRLASLESNAGLQAVFDRTGSVRLRHAGH
jgi:hypothetical protein